ncbi:MAG: molybdopterin-dependent oxidoreductase [Nitrospirae bacterium]|nr:molybdopterin-dependent oxidoreductase [Nitrospirota bacterium]
MSGKNKKGLTRRDFLRAGAAATGGAVLASSVPGWLESVTKALTQPMGQEILYELGKPENQIYTVCQNCNTGCSIKVKLLDGTLMKIEGSPYAPSGMLPHVPYNTSPFDMATTDGHICPKGQSGLQIAYDPYRITKVLKRNGPRGSMKWKSIPFDQAIKEIVEGGKIFADIGEKQYIEGLKKIRALTDPDLAKKMADEAGKITKEKDAEKKKELIKKFKETFKEHLHVLINPDHPDLGPKNNQFLYFWGRAKAGRSDFRARVTDNFGTVNAHGHTTVCQGSLYFAGYAMSTQWYFEEKDKKEKWGKASKAYWQGDAGHSNFVIFVGTNLFEANYPPMRAQKVTEGIVEGRLKFVVIDPRFSKTAAKAWKWMPAKTGEEAAIAMGMIRWIIDNNRYDERYLKNANKKAADNDGEPTWSNASWLVKIEDGRPGHLLTTKDLGLPSVKKTGKVKDKEEEYDFYPFIAMQGNNPVPFDPNDKKIAVEGDLFVSTTVQGLDKDKKPVDIQVKSVLQIIYEDAVKNTLDGWAKIADVKPEEIAELAREFTSYGKRAVVDVHRGVSQHTNGIYNCMAWWTLNILIGNLDWKGGACWAGTYPHMGDKEGQPFDVAKLNPGKIAKWGTTIIRHGEKYEESTLFKGYPAKRQWYPHASDIYQEIIPSMGDRYPYPIKAAFMYMGSPVYSCPGGAAMIEILKDTKKVPLFFVSDITIGTTSMYADYIFPDITYLERWEFHGSHPNNTIMQQPVRQPSMSPLVDTCKVYKEEMPICLESMLLAITERLGLKGFGPEGFGSGMPLTRPEHFYLKLVANLAAGDKDDTVPSASSKEIELFTKARRHLPKTIFDVGKWKLTVGPDWWPKVVYVLNRGGRFMDFDKAFTKDQLNVGYKKLALLYNEKIATTKDAMTGKYLTGHGAYTPSNLDFLRRPIKDDLSYDMVLITNRDILQTKSRTISSPWLRAVLPENFLYINSVDAIRLGFKSGDKAKVTSATNPEGEWDLGPVGKRQMIGTIKVIEGIRPGVVSFPIGWAHWATGAEDFEIDGKTFKGEKERAVGINANAAMRLDPVIKNTSISDPVGASVVFYDTRVKLVKV